VRPEGLCQRKVPKTPSGIEPATFRLVGQCFNQTVIVTSRNLLRSGHEHATSYGPDDPGYKFQQGQEIDLSPKASTPVWNPPSLLLNGYRDYIPEGKAAEIKNEWSNTSTPPI